MKTHLTAIVPGSKKIKGCIINERCMGCGLCIFKRPSGPRSLELVRPAEHIPTISVNELFRGRVS